MKTFQCGATLRIYRCDEHESVIYHELQRTVSKAWAELNLIQWSDGTWRNVHEPKIEIIS